MSDADRDRIFVEGVKTQLDVSLERVDEEMRRRLRRARLRALEQGEVQRKSAWHVIRIPAFTAAAAAALIIAFMTYMGQPTRDQAIVQVENAELLSSKENFELLVNFDFYLWLSEEEMNDVG